MKVFDSRIKNSGIRLLPILISAMGVFGALALVASQNKVSALTSEQKRVLDSGIRYFNVEDFTQSANVYGPAKGLSGSCDSALLPNIKDQAKLAEDINRYIRDVNPNSPLANLGNHFVAGAVSAGVNPILTVMIAQKETGLGSGGSGISSGSHNSFGLTATESQPNVKTNRLWYKWESWEASLNSSYDIHDYIKLGYIEGGLDRGVWTEIVDIMPIYAPPTENDTELYISQLYQWIATFVQDYGGALECGI